MLMDLFLQKLAMLVTYPSDILKAKILKKKKLLKKLSQF